MAVRPHEGHSIVSPKYTKQVVILKHNIFVGAHGRAPVQSSFARSIIIRPFNHHSPVQSSFASFSHIRPINTAIHHLISTTTSNSPFLEDTGIRLVFCSLPFTMIFVTPFEMPSGFLISI